MPASPEETRPDLGLRVRVGLCYLSFVLIGVTSGVGGVALPAQMADYGVDRAAIGLTFFGFSAGFLLAGITNGGLMHRAGLRGSLILGGAGFVVITLATAARPPFGWFVLLSLPAGYAGGVLESVVQVYLAELPMASVRMGRLHAFFGVGALVGPVLASRILVSLPWTTIWLIEALAAVPIVLGFAFLLHHHGEPQPVAVEPVAVQSVAGSVAAEPVAVQSVAGGAERKGLLLGTLRQPAVLLGGLMLATYVGLEISLGNWAYSFLVGERGQGALAAGNMVSGYWLGLTVGRFVISPVATRLRWTEVRTSTICLFGVVVTTMFVWLVPGTAATALGLGLVGFFLGPIFPNTMAAAPRLTDAARVPTAIGVLNGVSVLGGSGLPWLAGVLTQQVALWTLLPFATVLAVLQLFVWGALARRLHPAVAAEAAAA